MKQGYIGRTGEMNLDLSAVIAVLNKKASGDKEVGQQNAQDVKEIGQYSDGKTITNEENALTEKGPNVPNAGDGKASLGEEGVIDSNKVKIPAGSELIGGEKDNKELKGTDTNMTGGDQGAGIDGAGHKRASSRDIINALSDRIVEASEKKMAPKEPVAKDKDIQPISGDSKIGDEEKFKAEEVKNTDVKSDSGFIGKEKETLESKPDEPKDQPSFPAGGGKMDNEELEPEKQEKNKGTVTAESKGKKVNAEATRIAGRMLEAGRISSTELVSKIAELSQYKIAQLSDLEKGIFAQQGLNTVSEGLESPVVIGEASNQREASVELTHNLESLFSLGKQNRLAQETEHDMRKMYGK